MSEESGNGIGTLVIAKVKKSKSSWKIKETSDISHWLWYQLWARIDEVVNKEDCVDRKNGVLFTAGFFSLA